MGQVARAAPRCNRIGRIGIVHLEVHAPLHRRVRSRRIVARIGEFIKVKTVEDAHEANKEVLEHIGDAMVLLKGLKDAIPQSGSGTAHHAAMRILTGLRKLEKELEDFAKNKYFKRPEEDKLAANVAK